MATTLKVLVLAVLVAGTAAYSMPYVFHFCKPFRPPHTLHIHGISPQNLPDFVIQLNKNARGMSLAKWGEREKYEVPFHVHFWFVHPSIHSADRTISIALGQGMRHHDWDRVDSHPLTLTRNQKYHVVVRATNYGYQLEVNGRAYRFKVNAGYVTWTKVHKVYAADGNQLTDAGCPGRRQKAKKQPHRKPQKPRKPPAKSPKPSHPAKPAKPGKPAPPAKPSPPSAPPVEDDDNDDGDEDESLEKLPQYPVSPQPYPPQPAADVCWEEL